MHTLAVVAGDADDSLKRINVCMRAILVDRHNDLDLDSYWLFAIINVNHQG